MFVPRISSGMDYIFILITEEPTCSLYGVNDDFPRYYHSLRLRLHRYSWIFHRNYSRSWQIQMLPDKEFRYLRTILFLCYLACYW